MLAFQVAVLFVCACLSAVVPRQLGSLPVLLLILCLAVVAERRPERTPGPPLLEALLAGIMVAATGAAASPLLPYLLVPPMVLGITVGVRAVLLASGVATFGLLLGGGLTGELGQRGYVLAAAEWVALAGFVGLVAGWAHALARPEQRLADGYRDVHALLRQLSVATRRLPGGLDAPTAANALLDRCDEVIRPIRAAVLVRTSGVLVPLVVRGAQRVPWRSPLDDGPVSQAWRTGVPVVDVRSADLPGRRQGSALCVVPVLAGSEPFGMVIVETTEQDAFTPQVVADLACCAQEATARLQATLLFEEVRSAALMEERDRIARDMHDGVAQDLAFVGYQLDDLRRHCSKVDAGLTAQVLEIRQHLTTLISDIRLSITDLATSVSPDRGPGPALTGYLRAACSGRDILLHLELQESAFRLPSGQEDLLMALTHLFVQRMRGDLAVRNVWVDIEIDPPTARLKLEHDGQDLDLPGLRSAAAALLPAGARIDVSVGHAGGTALQVALMGENDDAQRLAG